MGWPGEPSPSRVHVGKGAECGMVKGTVFSKAVEQKLGVCEELGKELLAEPGGPGAVTWVVGY